MFLAIVSLLTFTLLPLLLAPWTFLVMLPLLILILSPSLLPPWIFLVRAIVDSHLATAATLDVSCSCHCWPSSCLHCCHLGWFLLFVPLLMLILSPPPLPPWMFLDARAIVDPHAIARLLVVLIGNLARGPARFCHHHGEEGHCA